MKLTTPYRFFLLCLVAVAAVGLIVFMLPKNNAPAPVPPATATSTPAIPPAASTTASTTPKPPLPAPAPAPVPSPQPPLNYDFGMATGVTLLSLSNADLNQRLNDMASLGIGWIRFDMAWEYIQPTNNGFTWAPIDRLVAAANAHHMKLLALLGYAPAWARSSTCPTGNDSCLSINIPAFNTFVWTAVNRYASQGLQDWEIWNEPNLRGSLGADPNASRYALLLRSVYPVIKAIEPSSTVVTGGLAPAATGNGTIAPIDFLTQLYAEGAKPYFDAVGDHPYSYPALPTDVQSWNAWSQMASTNPSMRSVMIANGDGAKKIWITEYGAPTGGPGLLESSTSDTSFRGHPDHVTEAVQSQIMAAAITAVKNVSWDGPFFWYSYKDLGTSTSTIENYFGIIRYDGSTKPAYDTLKSLIAAP